MSESIAQYESEARAVAGARFAVVASRWNAPIVDALVTAAMQTLQQRGVADDDLDVIRVPGAWEIPVVVAKLAAQGRHAAIIALGCVVRGDTRHYEQVADGASDGLMRVALDHALPVVNGVLAVDHYEHAEARAGGNHGNKGEEAALVAIEMANLMDKLA